MATKLNILSARAVKTIKQPGRHADGGNLYFKVDSDGSRRWVLFYRSQCKMKEMGLGGAKSVSLATAREIAGPVLFLCTPMAGFISGEILNVNGGAVLVG